MGRISRPSTSTKTPESPNIPDQHETDKQQINTENETPTPKMTQMNPDDDTNTRIMTQTNPDDETTTKLTQTPDEEDFNDQLQRRMRDQEEDHLPESSLSPQSSPYHPDIGDSNGTVLGSEPPTGEDDDEDDETT